MDRTIRAVVQAAPSRTLQALADLSTYPHWLGLVADATLDPPPEPPLQSGAEPQPAWVVTLRAQIGPLSRRKRLRLRRAHLDVSSVSFVRDETDGRDHAEWQLDTSVAPADAPNSTVVTMRLAYGGTFWSAPIGAALDAAQAPAAQRLSSWIRETDA